MIQLDPHGTLCPEIGLGGIRNIHSIIYNLSMERFDVRTLLLWPHFTMKARCVPVLLIFSLFLQATSALDFSGLDALIQRRLPQHTGYFSFQDISGSGDKYTIQDTEQSEGGVTISCTSLSACARGLYE